MERVRLEGVKQNSFHSQHFGLGKLFFDGVGPFSFSIIWLFSLPLLLFHFDRLSR
jgi:hypothetical protein